MHLRPDPDFEEFALDCIRLSNEEKSPTLRRKLLTLAREWMHAAMHQQGAEIHRESTERTDANSGEPWSEMDISDLTRWHGCSNSSCDPAWGHFVWTAR